MARINNLTNFLTDVATAIKNKKGVNTNIPAANFDIEINAFNILHGQEKTVTPLITNQSILPDANYNAMTVVNIVGVDSTIDSNIQPENIKRGITILGIEGNVEPDKPNQSKSVDPATSQQVVQPDIGYELASVTVNAVTSAIDINIQEGNIKEGVNILGVVGTFEGSGGGIDLNTTNLTREQVQEKAPALNIFQYMTLDSSITNAHALFAETNYTIVPNVDLVNILDVSNLCANCQSLINIPNFNTPDATNFSYMFYNCYNLVGAFNPEFNSCAFNMAIRGDTSAMFMNCSNLISVPDFDYSLVNNVTNMFSGCTNLIGLNTNDMTNVINYSGFLKNASHINSVNIVNLVNAVDLSEAFAGCTNLQALDCANWNLSNTTSMENCFYSCENLDDVTYAGITNSLPNANQLSNQYLNNIGLNMNKFTNKQLRILNAKGYKDAIVPEPEKQTYYDIYYNK